MLVDRFMTAPRRVFAGFAIYSFAMGNIFPRLPAVQEAMGVQEGAFGIALIGAPVGTMISLTLAAPFLDRIGYRRALLALIPALALFYAIATFATSPLAFFLLLIPVGLVIGGIEIILNVEADRVEHAAGFRIMNRAHAFWSFGFFGAGLFGSLMALAGISPQMHLALVVPLVILALALFMSEFTPAPARHEIVATAAPKFALPTGAILILVAVTLSAMLLEGGSMDWGAIYMRNEFAAGPFIAGLAVAVAALSQALARFVADGFITRYSPVRVSRLLLGLLLAGCLTVVFSPHWLMSLVGFGLIGVGSSAIFPLAMSAAAQRTDRPASLNVAALAQFSFVVFLLGPPLLGLIAERWGIRASFGVGLPLVLLSLLTAGALGHRRR
ncbi:MAG: MFS transporter [Rubellimicrobium sp.]|nr:MFS transporter [Rubellimicrobium sp.]